MTCKIALALRVALLASTFATPVVRAQSSVVLALSPEAQPAERAAAAELATHLHALFPTLIIQTGTAQAGTPIIYLGSRVDLPPVALDTVRSRLTVADSFVVDTLPDGGQGAVIAGESARATLYAVDALLEKLGFGFFLSYNTSPAPRSSFSFDAWHLADAPLAATRTIFEWHNFLSGCSTWNLEQWQQWITQASRLRFNTVMVHAYGNNPMFSFTHNGVTKPTGYLSDTARGREWGTEHVEDVRAIVGSKGFFSSAVFGSDAAEVPNDQHGAAATRLMQQVFAFAADRGMNVTFALDVDTDSANPQNVIGALPASARFTARGMQMANPDTPEGYAYYKSEIAQLMTLYPQITTVALWFRGDLTSLWRSLRAEDFPSTWKDEYRQALERNPALAKDAQAPGLFAIGKIGRAFRRALKDTGHPDVTLAAGSWRFAFLQSADAFMPEGTVLMPLDYNYEFPGDPLQEAIRNVARHRPVNPIIWAQHDDREYAGRSYVPTAGLASTLQWGNTSGYGVIHWTTRPLDLFFKNVADQVWSSSRNESLITTASQLAGKTFGKQARALGTEYLMDWIYDAPAFGRETSDFFIDQTLDARNATPGAMRRLALLDKMEPQVHDDTSREWLRYFQGWEVYAEHFYKAQDALQRSQTALKQGNTALAREEMLKASPEATIEQYAKTVQHGGPNLGEKGLLVSMNLRWLPYFEAQRQALALQPLDIIFSPTVHEALAQLPGKYTFAFSTSHRISEVLGEDELKVPVSAQGTSTQCTGGVSVTSVISLKLTGLAGTPLASGAYEVTLHSSNNHLLLVKTNGKDQAGDLPVQIQAADGAIQLRLSSPKAPTWVCGVTLQKVR